MRRRAFTLAGLYAAGQLRAQKKKGSPNSTKTYRDAEVFPAVKAVMVKLEKADEGKVTSGARFIEDLDFDSLDVVELVLECEDEFGIEISDEEGAKLKTVQNLVDQVKAKLKQQQRIVG
jgi:acyl carrier protein